MIKVKIEKTKEKKNDFLIKVKQKKNHYFC